MSAPKHRDHVVGAIRWADGYISCSCGWWDQAPRSHEATALAYQGHRVAVGLRRTNVADTIGHRAGAAGVVA